MKYIGTIQNGSIVFNVTQLSMRKRQLHDLKNGTPISEEIKVVRQSKTHQQVKTIFGLAIQRIKQEFDDRGWDNSILLGLNIPTGNEVTTGLLKEFLYAVCPIRNEEGKRITLSHKDCDTKAASRFFDEIAAWAASQWSVFIPAPDINWREKKFSPAVET